MLQTSTVRFAIQALYRIEQLETRSVDDTAIPPAQDSEEVEALLERLPTLIRVRYQWLRTWTPYPVARLRGSACTGCGAVYQNGHAFLRVNGPQVACCEQCLRILVLNDLALIA